MIFIRFALGARAQCGRAWRNRGKPAAPPARARRKAYTLLQAPHQAKCGRVYKSPCERIQKRIQPSAALPPGTMRVLYTSHTENVYTPPPSMARLGARPRETAANRPERLGKRIRFRKLPIRRNAAVYTNPRVNVYKNVYTSPRGSDLGKRPFCIQSPCEAYTPFPRAGAGGGRNAPFRSLERPKRPKSVYTSASS